MAVFHSAANRLRVSAVSAILASCLIVGGIVPCRLVADDAPGSLELVEMSSAGGAVLKKLDDGSILVTGKNADKDVYVVVANSDLKKITGLRLEVLKHDSLPSGGPGRLFNGTFILTRVEITAAPQKTNEPARAVAIKTATADFTQQGHSVLNLIDGKPGPGWAIWDGATANRRVDFQFDKPLALESGAKLTITLKHESVWAGGNLGRFRLSVTDSVMSDKIDPRAVVTKADVEAVMGRVYLDKGWLDAVLADERTGRDQLAFVLAHELSHVSLGHTRRRYQLRWLEPYFAKDVERKAITPEDQKNVPFMKDLLRAVGALSENVYTREESYQSDLFAIHLCRNAGFDVENCLDVLRAEAVQKKMTLLDEPPPREGTPPIEPEIQPSTTRELMTLASTPSAAQRLRRMRLELDGLVYGEFGLFEFDRAKKLFARVADASVPADARAVVCIHGMESSRDVWLPLLSRLAEEPATAKVDRRLFAFQYPADDSLARSGKFLQRELQRVCGSAKQIDFVVHSAGGLVFRWYAEVERGEFRRAVFLGTPHQGSDLAKLRGLLEAVQFAGDISLGFDAALQKAILDGRGQITFDLAPGSLFLSDLNRERADLHRDQYSIHRGKVLSTARALLLRKSVDAARVTLTRKLNKEKESLLAAFGASALDALSVPQEISDGDLCVTSDSALLDGVKNVATHELKHTALPRDPKVMSLVIKRLTEEQ